MENQEAINVLIQVALLAQKGGLLGLEDAAMVLKAVQTLKPAEVLEATEVN